MGIINSILGNASEANSQSLEKMLNPILCANEHIDLAFKLMRDSWVFTNKRLIITNIQGVTGKKKEMFSIPYHSINYFSIETSGTFDMDCEIKIWIKGNDTPLEQKFGTGVDIKEVGRTLAQYIL